MTLMDFKMASLDNFVVTVNEGIREIETFSNEDVNSLEKYKNNVISSLHILNDNMLAINIEI